MSVTVDFNGITTVRTGVTSTYVLSLHSLGSSAVFYKIGRTRNLPSRIMSLLSAFNDGTPKSYQGYPAELVGLCAMEGYSSGCEFGDDCSDKQYELTLLANIEGDVEQELHRRFAHLRVGPDGLHNGVRTSEWFNVCFEDDDNYPASIDAWLDSRAAVSA